MFRGDAQPPNSEVAKAIVRGALGPDPQDEDIEVCAVMAAGSNPSPRVLAVLVESGFDSDGGQWTIDDLLRAAAVESTYPEIVKTPSGEGRGDRLKGRRRHDAPDESGNAQPKSRGDHAPSQSRGRPEPEIIRRHDRFRLYEDVQQQHGATRQ